MTDEPTTKAYTVKRCVDAVIVSFATVDAANEADAARMARDNAAEIEWKDEYTSEYATETFVTLDEAFDEITETHLGGC